MNKYETVFIMSDKIERKQKNSVIERITTFIKNNGEIVESNDMGLRRLAYDIRKCKQGNYFQVFFNAEPEIIPELERIYRITDEILKFITLKIERCD